MPRMLPRQTPYKRTYPSGRVAWVARYYGLDGVARYAKPHWNAGKSAFKLRWKARKAIDEALGELYEAPPGARVWYEDATGDLERGSAQRREG